MFWYSHVNFYSDIPKLIVHPYQIKFLSVFKFFLIELNISSLVKLIQACIYIQTRFSLKVKNFKSRYKKSTYHTFVRRGSILKCCSGPMKGHFWKEVRLNKSHFIFRRWYNTHQLYRPNQDMNELSFYSII